MDVSEKASSARVAPRSVIRAAATSRMIVRHVRGVRADGAGAGHVAHGAVAHDHALDGLVRAVGQERAGGEPHAVAAEHVALVGEVDGRHLQVLALDVLPDVHLRPVGDGEDAHVLAAPDPAVVEVPQLRPLVTWAPTARTRRAARRRAPWRVPSPRRAGRRRRRCRTGAPGSRPAGSWSGAGCATGCRAPPGRGPCRSTPGRRPRSGARPAPRRAGRGTRAPPGSCGRCRCA